MLGLLFDLITDITDCLAWLTREHYQVVVTGHVTTSNYTATHTHTHTHTERERDRLTSGLPCLLSVNIL